MLQNNLECSIYQKRIRFCVWPEVSITLPHSCLNADQPTTKLIGGIRDLEIYAMYQNPIAVILARRIIRQYNMHVPFLEYVLCWVLPMDGLNDMLRV